MQLSDTKNIHALTAELGLTLNESEVYFFLLKNGLTAGADIYVHLGMDKSSSYRALNSLQNKNLVYKIGEERNLKYGANPTDTLLSLFDTKQTDLARSKKQLSSILDSLDSYIKKDYLDKNITILEGFEGYKEFIESRLQPNTKLIREIATRSDIEKYFGNIDSYDKYMKKYIKKRIELSINLKTLMSVSDRDDYIDISSKAWLKEVRMLPETFDIGAIITTWNDMTGFFSEEKGNIICVRIKDILITNIFNNMFDMIWKMSEIKPEESNI